MALVLLTHENQGKDKHVESVLFPRLDEGSIPSWSTPIDALSHRSNDVREGVFFYDIFITIPPIALYAVLTHLLADGALMYEDGMQVCEDGVQKLRLLWRYLQLINAPSGRHKGQFRGSVFAKQGTPQVLHTA